MRASVDNRLRLPLADLRDDDLTELQRRFTYENPDYERQQKRTGFKPRGIPRYLHSWELVDGTLALPRGGLERIEEVVGRIEVVEGFKRTSVDIPDHRFQLRPYQGGLIDAIVAKRTALIRSPQGSGKTTVGVALTARLKRPTLVVVPTERIKVQWFRAAEKQLGLREHEVGLIQGSTRRIRPLTIGMQQTLRNCAQQYGDYFEVVIGDEAQRFAANTFFDVIDVLPAEYRVGLTADERRADGKEFLVYDVFGEVVREVPRSVLIAEGAIIDAEVRIVPSDFRPGGWYERLSPKHRANGRVQQRLAEELINDKQRNELIMELLGWCRSEGKTTLTLTARREHCSLLNSLSIARGWDSGLMIGGVDSAAEFERTERELNEGILTQAVGTYSAIGVGFDLTRLGRGIFASPCASRDGQQQFGQFCGRYERPEPATGKVSPGAVVVYYVWDRHVNGLSAVRNLARWKPKCFVLDNNRWVHAKEFLRTGGSGHEETNDSDGDQLGFVSLN